MKIAKEKTTQFIVTKRDQLAKNVDNDVHWHTRLTFINRSKDYKIRYGYNLKDLSNTSDLNIFIQRFYGKKRVKLPNFMKDGLIRFFKEKKYLDSDFDCGSFIHFLLNIPYFDHYFDPDIWDIAAFKGERNLKVGSVILISKRIDDDDITNKHVAIYLGFGVYISKFGGGLGNIIFATLEQMKKGFDGNIVYSLSLK